MNNKRKHDLEAIRDHFKGLSSGSIKPRDKYQGVYNELQAFIGDSGVVMEAIELIPQWKGFSGIRMFPVKHPTMSPQDAYFEQNKIKHWSGDYGNERKKLCKWLSEEFDKKLKEV